VLAVVFPPAWLWVKTYPESFSTDLTELPEQAKTEEEILLDDELLGLDEELEQ